MKLYKLWCEWDIGQDGLVFASYDDAMEWAREAGADLVEEGDTFEDIWEAYMSVDELTLVGEL